MHDTVSRLMRDQAGATAIEYALIASLIAVAIVGAVIALGGSVTGLFNTVANDV
jgi:pilus assembly protein Flp/PilA